MELDKRKKTGLIIVSVLVILLLTVIIIYYILNRRKSYGGKLPKYIIGTWIYNPLTDFSRYYQPGNCFNLAYLNLPTDTNTVGSHVKQFSQMITSWRKSGRLFIPSFNFGNPDSLVDIMKSNPGYLIDWCNTIKNVVEYDGIMYDYEPVFNGDDPVKSKTYMDTLRNLVSFLDSEVGKGNYIGSGKLLFFSFGESVIRDSRPGAKEAINSLRDIMFSVKNITVLYDWQKYSSPGVERMISDFLKGDYAPMKKYSLFTVSGLQMNKYDSLSQIKDILKGIRGFTLWVIGDLGDPSNGLDSKFIGNIC